MTKRVRDATLCQEEQDPNDNRKSIRIVDSAPLLFCRYVRQFVMTTDLDFLTVATHIGHLFVSTHQLARRQSGNCAYLSFVGLPWNASTHFFHPCTFYGRFSRLTYNRFFSGDRVNGDNNGELVRCVCIAFGIYQLITTETLSQWTQGPCQLMIDLREVFTCIESYLDLFLPSRDTVEIVLWYLVPAEAYCSRFLSYDPPSHMCQWFAKKPTAKEHARYVLDKPKDRLRPFLLAHGELFYRVISSVPLPFQRAFELRANYLYYKHLYKCGLVSTTEQGNSDFHARKDDATLNDIRMREWPTFLEEFIADIHYVFLSRNIGAWDLLGEWISQQPLYAAPLLTLAQQRRWRQEDLRSVNL